MGFGEEESEEARVHSPEILQVLISKHFSAWSSSQHIINIRYKLVRLFSLPSETVRHIWLSKFLQHILGLKEY